MKKTVFIFCTLLCTLSIKAQKVPSVCSSSDSIKALYEADASRLAVLHEIKFGDTYRDSVIIRPVLKKRYLDALLAVYNANALAVRDTVIMVYDIHTNLKPGVSSIVIAASPTLAWMQQLSQNLAPVSSTVINGLMNTYNLSFTYVQSSNGDIVIAYTPEGMNLPPLVQLFKAESSIDTVYADGTFNEARNITDSLNGLFVELNYSIGWGTCQNGCDYRHQWTLRVYTDCSVEYMGQSGAALFVGIPVRTANAGIKMYPTPAKDKLFLDHLLAGSEITVYDLQGKKIVQEKTDSEKFEISVAGWLPGIYQMHVKQDGVQEKLRILIQ